MSLSRLRFAVLATSSCAAFAFACGGISDPTKGSGGDGNVATVSGALTGVSVPANARVALVWRTPAVDPSGGGYAVGDDVPVVGGKFTMSLSAPPDAYFSTIDGADRNFGSSSSGGEPPNVGGPEPTPLPAPTSGGGGGGGGSSGGGKAFNPRIAPRGGDVSGGFSNPLSGAVAGFVVYVDTNGNGKLDLAGPYAASTDTILGGNRELVLAYLKDGGGLDYEKLRDTSGILPAQGFNLAWTQGKRWMPLNVVQLKLDPKQGLPSPVCSSSSSVSGGGSDTGGFDPVASPPPPDTAAGTSSSGSGGGGSTPPGLDGGGTSSSSGGSTSGNPGTGYPSPTDPNLHCAPDGRSFSYEEPPTDCPPPPPAPVGLCASDYGDATMPCRGSIGWGQSLPSGASPPPGWPCTVAEPIDGGPAPDAGG